MLNLLAWNLKNNAIEQYIAECIAENDIDLAIFTEYKSIDFDKLQTMLGNYYVKHGENKLDTKVTMFARKNISVTITQEQSRYVIYKVDTPLKTYNICGVHMEDRRNYKSSDRSHTADIIVRDIEQIENMRSCMNTIVMGDFNANPYDEEMLSIYAFNAVLFRDVINDSDVRKWNSFERKRFYNPMLNFITEEQKMYGSFYYSGENESSYWHCLDQVIVRRPLIECIDDIQYIKQINGHKLTNNIRPNSAISDHLPLMVNLLEV